MSSTAKPSSRTPVAPPVSVVREIDSPADTVWAMVSDLARMGEWSPENQGGQWVNGATGPALGARFKGRNANGKKSWGTTVEVVEYDAPRMIAFALMVGRSRWCDWVYTVEATATGARVTHSWIDYRSRVASWVGGLVSGVNDRATHNRRNMELTLDALAVAAGGPTTLEP